MRNDDSAWGDIVRWTLFGMIEAEELGVSSENVEEMLESDSPAIRRLLGVEGNIGEEMGLAPDFMVNVLRHVGNYGEIYEANIGEDTPVGIPRAGTQKRSVDPWRPDLRDALPLIGTFPRARLLRGAGPSGDSSDVPARSARWPSPNRPRYEARNPRRQF